MTDVDMYRQTGTGILEQTDEEQQQNERLQRNRQDIMQAEGLVSLLLKLIDKAGFGISTQKYDA